MLFEKVFIINLKRRTDRRQRMMARIAQANLPCPVAFFDAVDAMDLPNDFEYQPYANWKDPSSTNEWYNRPLKLGEIACSLSHYQVWQQMKREQISRALILEDDAAFADNFWARCQVLQQEVPADFELLYFYRFRLPLTKDTKISENVVIPGFSHCTVAYVITLDAVDKMLKSIFIMNLIPIDEFLPCLYAEEARADVKALFDIRLKTYAAYPDLVAQDDKQQMGSDTEASAFFQEGHTNDAHS